MAQLFQSYAYIKNMEIAHRDMPYAVVAGGSKGIGFGIAQALARRGYSLVLVGRNAESLQIAQQALVSRYNVEVGTITADLSQQEAAVAVAEWCSKRELPVKILCNVAGIGGAKDYLALPPDELRYMVRLNIEANMALCLALLPLLEKNAPAYILNVSSLAGFVPIPVKNLYSATRAATIFFSYSLRYQLLKKNISVSCLCPGPVFSKPEIEKDTREKLGWFGAQMAITPEKVGEIAVKKTLEKKLIIVPGAMAKIVSIVLRTVPRRLLVSIIHKFGSK